jgi:hypothetical protein
MMKWCKAASGFSGTPSGVHMKAEAEGVDVVWGLRARVAWKRKEKCQDVTAL